MHPARPSLPLPVLVLLREVTSLPQRPLSQESTPLTLPFLSLLMFIASGQCLLLPLRDTVSSPVLPRSQRTASVGRPRSRQMGDEGGPAGEVAPWAPTSDTTSWTHGKFSAQPEGSACGMEIMWQRTNLPEDSTPCLLLELALVLCSLYLLIPPRASLYCQSWRTLRHLKGQ